MDNPEKLLDGPRTSKRHYAMLLITALVFAGLFYTGYKPWRAREDRLLVSTSKPIEIIVSTVNAKRAANTAELSFTGALTAAVESTIYARADGYIKLRTVELGDRVKAGQLLAEIDSPELDEQLRQSRYRYDQFKAQSGATMAALRLSQANLNLAQVQFERTEKLVKEGITSKSELDERKAVRDVRAAEAAAAQANVEAAEEGKRAVNSEIERFLRLTAFKRVLAPFDGVITVRNCEVGNLITAAAVANGRDLFRLADAREMEFNVAVPQNDAAAMRPGTVAALRMPEYPGRVWTGRILNIARALEPASRTMLTQIRIANSDGLLMPGMTGEVRIQSVRTSVPVLIPGDTPVVRSDGMYVATLDAGNLIRFKKLTVGRDLGGQIEILSGLEGGERLVVNPSDEIQEGAKVTPAEEKPRSK